MNNGKSMPHHFENFLGESLAENMCRSILDYCKYLIKLDKKKSELEIEAKKRGVPPPKPLKSELEKLNLKAKKMGENYGRLIYSFRSIGASKDKVENKCHSFLTFKSAIYHNKENDNAFYKCLVTLYSLLFSQIFDRKDMSIVQTELERLFKTNVFN